MKTIGTFLALSMAAISFSSLSACDTVFHRNQIIGSGVQKTEKRTVAGFKGVEIAGAIEAVIVAQQDFSLEIETDDNILPFVETKVVDGILHISMNDSYSFSDATVRVRIGLPDLSVLDISGASTADVSRLNAGDLRIEVSGASKVTAQGSSQKLTGDVSGASSLMANQLTSQRVSIEASGASEGHVHAVEALHAEASGASTVYYSGDPQTLEKETSGASLIKRR